MRGAPLWLLALAAAVLALVSALAHDARYRITGPNLLRDDDPAAWRRLGEAAIAPDRFSLRGWSQAQRFLPGGPGHWLITADWRVQGLSVADEGHLSARILLRPHNGRGREIAENSSPVFHRDGNAGWRHVETVVAAPPDTAMLRLSLQLHAAGAEMQARQLSVHPAAPAAHGALVLLLLRLAWTAWAVALLLRLWRLVGGGWRRLVAVALALAAIGLLMLPQPPSAIERPVLGSFLAAPGPVALPPAAEPASAAEPHIAAWLPPPTKRVAAVAHVALFAVAAAWLLVASHSFSAMLGTLLVCAVAGEAAQLVTVGRGVQPLDGAANLAGVLAVALLVGVWRRLASARGFV